MRRLTAALVLVALTVQPCFCCEPWCKTEECESLKTSDKDAVFEALYKRRLNCGDCIDEHLRCRAWNRFTSILSRRSKLLVAGCPVVEVPSSDKAIAAMARSLQDSRQPTILRGGFVDLAGMLRASPPPAHSSETRSLHEWMHNPPHAMCSERDWGDNKQRSDFVPAESLDDSFVQACEWAESRLYGDSPLWRALWSYDGRSAPTGQAVISRNRAVGFHAHGPTLNALFSGRRRWFMFDLPKRGGTDGWKALPLLRRLVLNESRTPLRWDWLPFALEKFLAVGASAAFECNQEAGDVMFVPNQLHHAILERGTEESRAVFFIEGKTKWTKTSIKGQIKGEQHIEKNIEL